MSSYLDRPAVFADFINGSIYGGRSVLSAEELETLPYTGKEDHPDRNGRIIQKMRSRDVAKIRGKNNQYAVIAIENQDEFHYFMPFRCMEYDTEDYARQIRRLRKVHGKEADLKSGAEYLSGVKETDKLKPVITLVFYHGKGKWDTCRELHDMIDFSGENEILREYTSNYRANIISLQELDEEKFQTGLREVIGMMKRKDDEKQMRQFFRANEERFRNVDEDTYDTISVMTDRKNLEKYKEGNRKEEGTVDMCRAFDEWEKEWFREGEQFGIQTGIQQGLTQGIAQGLALGEQKLALLAGRLLADGRIEDLQIALVSEENRQGLYEEYGLSTAGAV